MKRILIVVGLVFAAVCLSCRRRSMHKRASRTGKLSSRRAPQRLFRRPSIRRQTIRRSLSQRM